VHRGGTFLGAEVRAARALEELSFEVRQHGFEVFGVAWRVTADGVRFIVDLPGETGPVGGVGAGWRMRSVIPGGARDRLCSHRTRQARSLAPLGMTDWHELAQRRQAHNRHP
jgi:hypothetical protein